MIREKKLRVSQLFLLRRRKMSKNLKFYTIDTEYIKYLRNIDNRVADTSIENKKEKRKFIGILL